MRAIVRGDIACAHCAGIHDLTHGYGR